MIVSKHCSHAAILAPHNNEAWSILAQVMNRKKASGEGIDSRGGMASMMSQMQGMMGDGARGGNAGPGMMGANSMMKGQGGVNNMSEDEYVRVWENYSKMSGQPFDAQTVRGWYRQHKQYSASR